MKVSTPYAHLVPREYSANLRFRRRLNKYVHESKENAREVWIMCSRDPIFFLNAFGWTYDPRKTECPVQPFIAYDFQEEAVLKMIRRIGHGDIGIEKSRDMGATWFCLFIIIWLFLFRDNLTFLVVSRKADLVEKSSDPDTLFAKIDFFLEHLPRPLVPPLKDIEFHMENLWTRSTIDGDATTGDLGRGGRRTLLFQDEFAAVEPVAAGYEMLKSTTSVTNTRMLNSTYRGTGNAFYDMMQSDAILKISLHWSLHPEKNVGLWIDENGKRRSQWYDDELKRYPHPRLAAEELDMDPVGSSYQFFFPETIERCIRDHARDPIVVGELDHDELGRPRRFLRGNDESMRLWLQLDPTGNPPRDSEYVVGGDIGMGTGATPSVLSVVDRRTNEKVAEIRTAFKAPHEFGRLAVAVCRWFNGALLIYEANGPGHVFAGEVIKLGYRNLWYHADETKLSRNPSDKPGWWSTPETKKVMLSDYRQALYEDRIINRSREALEECRMYVVMPDRTIVHNQERSTQDPTGARENHADTVIADGLAAKGLAARPLRWSSEAKMPKECWAARRKAYLASKKQEEYW